MKILSGNWKNSILYSKKKNRIKPTSTIIRKILFSWLKKKDLLNKNCLDLFSGLGTLGFEAASRGCKSTLVESNNIIFKCLINFKNKVKANNVFLYKMNYINYINKFKYLKYDLIFLDPPYNNFKNLFFLIKKCLNLVKKNSFIFIESNLNLFLIKNYFNFSLKIKKNSFLGKKNFFLFQVI